MPCSADGSNTSITSESDEQTFYENNKWTSTADLNRESTIIREEIKLMAQKKRPNLIRVKSRKESLFITKTVMMDNKPAKAKFAVKQSADSKGKPMLILKLVDGK